MCNSKWCFNNIISHIHGQNSLILDKEILKKRLSKRIVRGEFAGLCLAFGLLCGFAYLQWQGLIYPNDYVIYIRAVEGGAIDYYYAYWMLPVFGLLKILPVPIGYLLWGMLNIAGVWLATRIFGGPMALVLISYQLYYVLFYGQITGVILGGLGLMWIGIVMRRWEFAGLGLVIALTKFQIGIVMGGLLLLFAPLTWRERMRVCIIPIMVFFVSLFVYPRWPWHLLMILQQFPPNDWGNISLWRWVGPYALLLFVPGLVLPLTRSTRFVMLIAAASISLPYFQQTDLLMFFSLPVGWFVLLGYIGYLFPIYGWNVFGTLSLSPLLWIVFQALRVSRQRFYHKG
jgi:hypothetical protein